jgi:hypothetical protein
MKKFAGDDRDASLDGGYINAEDTTCIVMCECGLESKHMISDYEIYRCPVCGKGYRVEFVVWQYEKNEGMI